MENKTITLSRHLALISVVQRNPGIELEKLAELFGFTAERMRKEIMLLDHAGIGDLLPDETFFFDMDLLVVSDRVALQYDLGASGVQPLTGPEVSRLIMGLVAISGSLSEEDASQVPHLVGVVLEMGATSQPPELPEFSGLVAVMEAGRSSWEDVISIALEEGRELNLTYLSGSSQLTQRTVDPLGKFQGPDGWILRAWCHRAQAERNFRVDRIVEASAGQLATPGQKRVKQRAGGDFCKVVLSPAAQWLLGELPVESARKVRLGTEVSFRVWDSQWMANQLTILAPYVVSVEPSMYQQLAKHNALMALPTWEELPGIEI